MRRTLIHVLLVAALAAGLSCNKNPAAPAENPLSSLSPSEKAVVVSGNGFGLKLFREIVRARPEAGTNIFISPLSASMALGMAYNGANGETREGMATALGLQGLSISEVNASYKALIDALLHIDPEVRIEIANSIWYRREFTFSDAFLNTNRMYFNAEVRGMDFSSPSTVEAINQWVDTHTGNHIRKIVESIDPAEVMLLVNAIFFKGNWTAPFEKRATRDDRFQLPDGTTLPVKMMFQEHLFPFFQTEEFQAIDLPYGAGQFSMAILLPAKGMDIDAFIESITPAQWDGWMARFANLKLRLEMPKFTIEYERTFNPDLKALGMGIAFDSEHADFSNMYPPGAAFPGNLYLTRVKQKTFIRVNEEGTEAAAATSVGVGITSVPPLLRIDRPFLLAIRERASGVILFIGKIAAPKV